MKQKLIGTFLAWLIFGCTINAFSQQSTLHNASALEWRLWGYRPEGWRQDFDFSAFRGGKAQHRNIPVKVPGSVNKALLDAGFIKDWNMGTNYTDEEWIENRSWVFVTRIPDSWIEKNKQIHLLFKGLDDNGTVLVNGKSAGTFNNAFLPYTFDITTLLKDSNNTLAVAFNPPPRYLGQVYWTSRIRDWKPRFYYGWDWIPRIVQIGIWDDVLVEVKEEKQPEITQLNVTTTANETADIGTLKIVPEGLLPFLKGTARITLKSNDGVTVIDENIPAGVFTHGKTYEGLKVRRWWPNGSGEQPLYTLECSLMDAQGNITQQLTRRVGFKHISWLPAKGAPAEADPWICSVNNKPIFLQGIDWTPIRPNFADLRESDYRKLLQTYKSLGLNMIRVWGGGFPEKDWLFDMCDELGIMIQQDFPLSSAGLDNYPPETPNEIAVMSDIAHSYLKKYKHHVAMLLWCGGNELYEYGDGAAVTTRHKMIRMLADIVHAEDPSIRFVPGSPSGMNIWGGRDNFGKGINWDTHGPWTLPFSEQDSTMNAVLEYWKADDALMHSEVGVPGTMSAAMINKYRGSYPALPAGEDNPYWNEFNWWLNDWSAYVKERGSKPRRLEDFVTWSQDRQTQGLAIALKTCKNRFPATGGFIIWMGHDAFPAPINTSIIDFEGNLKPVALELKKIWLAPAPPYQQ